MMAVIFQILRQEAEVLSVLYESLMISGGTRGEGIPDHFIVMSSVIHC